LNERSAVGDISLTGNNII